MKVVHTTHGPAGDADVAVIAPGTVEVVRDSAGADSVHAFGRVWTPRDADQIARLLSGAAGIAAAHNAGAIA